MKPELNNKVLKNFSYLGIVQLLNYIFPIITIPLVARVLGVEKLGLVNYIFSYVAYFSLIVTYSFNFSAVRRYSETQNINKVFGLTFTSQCYLFVFSTLSYILLVTIVDDLRNNLLLSLIAYLAVATILFEKNWVFQVYQELKILALVNLVIKSLTTILIFFIISKKEDYIYYALILNGVNFLTTVVTFFYCQYRYRIQWKFHRINEVLKNLKLEKALFFSAIVISLYTTTNIVLLGYFSNVEEVGLYAAAQKILDIGKMFLILPVTQIIYPIVSLKIKQNTEAGVDFVRKLMPIFLYSSIILVFGTIIFGPLVLYVLYGSDFTGAIPILLILSISSFFSFFSAVFGILIMLNLDMDKYFLNNQIFVACFSVLTLILILPKGGAITASIVLVLSEFFITSYQFYFLRKKGYFFITKEILKISNLKKSLLLLRGGVDA